jgi:hypothetical protein
MLAGIHLTQTGELPLHLFESFRRAATGLLVGGSIGFLLGLLNGLSVLADRVLDSSVQMMRNIPHLAIQHPDGKTALEKGNVDAWAGLDPYMAQLEVEKGYLLFFRNKNGTAAGFSMFANLLRRIIQSW